jgi:hypothetical protein
VVLSQTEGLKLQEYVDWLKPFLFKRELARPNGEMLFSYRATKEEYLALRRLLAHKLGQLAGAPWTFHSASECACFVLYAAEWWRREYNGGPWRWTHILQSLGQPFSLDVLERTAAVERGLKAWGHRPGGQGKKYLGAIVAHGGLPLQLVARGDGSITKLLIRGMRQAQLYGWDSKRLESFFEAHELELVQHLRDDDIYRLLASVVVTVLALRQECQLAGVSNPVDVLDRVQPNWRDRFPIAVDDASAEPLLVGLVREAAKEYAPVTSFPVVVSRSLHLGDDGETYSLALSAEMPASITLAALSSATGVAPDALPQSFSLDLLGQERIVLGDGRQLLGGTDPTVVLSGRTKRIQGDGALAEQLLALRSVGEDLHTATEVPGADALDGQQPWVFAARSAGLLLAGVGSCRVPEDCCLVAVPEGYVVTPEGEPSRVELKGVTGGLTHHRWIYEVRGCARVTCEDLSYAVRTDQSAGLTEQLLWRGTRVPYTTGSLPVYLGMPLLCRVSADGTMTQVSSRDVEWVVPSRGGTRVDQPRTHRGPVDAWLIEQGVRQRRFRMALLPADARIRFRSGQSEREGAIEFQSWGIESIDAPLNLGPRVELQANGLRLDLCATTRPPSHLPVSVGWPGSPRSLHLELPFPATGGRFTTADGGSLPLGRTVPIRQLHAIRVQVFDQNPEAPRRYSLRSELSRRVDRGGPGRLGIEHAIRIDRQGFGELRLLEIESTLLGLMCQSDELDAKLELQLLVAGSVVAKVTVTRYDADLEPHMQTMGLSDACLATLTPEALTGVNLRALPLLLANAQEVVLKQSMSEGAATGRWSVSGLSSEHGPWIIYPASSSDLQVRPTLYPGFAIGAASARRDVPCPLGNAMAFPDAADRSEAIAAVAAEMANDLDHVSWELITRQYQVLSHLPLSTFDYWRSLAATMPSSLAVLLKLSHDAPALIGRMRDELGVVWELMPRATLTAGLARLQESWAKQLKVEKADPVVKTLSEQVFRAIGQPDPLLGDLIELVLFQAGFNRSERLDRLIAPFAAGPRGAVQGLWLGENSVLQRFLLRTHTEDRSWPHFDLVRDLIALVEQGSPEAVSHLMKECGKDLLWLPSAGQTGPYAKNIKEDVANAPLLAGLASQLLPAAQSWWTKSQLGQLRQIRNFDPAWFEVGCRAGLLLSLMAEQRPSQAEITTGQGKSAAAGSTGRPPVASAGLQRVTRVSGSA